MHSGHARGIVRYEVWIDAGYLSQDSVLIRLGKLLAVR